jgi:hypothetical protein
VALSSSSNACSTTKSPTAEQRNLRSTISFDDPSQLTLIGPLCHTGCPDEPISVGGNDTLCMRGYGPFSRRFRHSSQLRARSQSRRFLWRYMVVADVSSLQHSLRKDLAAAMLTERSVCQSFLRPRRIRANGRRSSPGRRPFGCHLRLDASSVVCASVSRPATKYAA